MFESIDVKAINTIRSLSIDAVEAANSGHPGLPLGAAPMAYVLWSKFLTINPSTSKAWNNRDRFILSAGHGSALLYSLLHLAGYDVSTEDLKSFRQKDSKTPGHPEVNHTDGVEATTGPLGQGIGMAVGMAMAETHLAAVYNAPGFPIVDHHTYSICGDGDLMEGVAQEACSLAGHLGLGKLVLLYDSNDISLDGPTNKSFTEDTKAKFKGYGWQYTLVEDGNDLSSIYQAIDKAKAETEKPTIIEVKTVIGFGSSNQGTAKVHGAPLGKEDVARIKASYGFEKLKAFEVSEEVKNHFYDEIVDKGKKAEKAWNELFDKYTKAYPKLAAQYLSAHGNDLPENWVNHLPTFEESYQSASRVTSSEIIQSLAENIPYLWGGSADLSSSNHTMIKGAADFGKENYQGRNIWFGVREFAMAAAANGIQLHGGSRVYCGTFFVFVDYLKAAIRLSAIQNNPVTYVLTHDSIAVGEDGPTHEPVEQLASLRSIPNINVIRPADGNETLVAWKIAMEAQSTPTVLVLSRQNLPLIQEANEYAEEGVRRGGYTISKQKGEYPDGILIATGSEVKLALEAQKQLLSEAMDVAVVSLPSFELFNRQSEAYKESVLPKNVEKRLAIEMGSSFGWHQYTGFKGRICSVDKFGASGPGPEIVEMYGFTVEKIVAMYKMID